MQNVLSCEPRDEDDEEDWVEVSRAKRRACVLEPARLGDPRGLFMHLGDGVAEVVIVQGRAWLIGAPLAAMLRRETFNLYRTLNLRGVGLERCDGSVLREQVVATRIPWKSELTVVPLEEFVEAWYPRETRRRPRPSTSLERAYAHLHRRKRPSWMVRRSLKTLEACFGDEELCGTLADDVQCPRL